MKTLGEMLGVERKLIFVGDDGILTVKAGQIECRVGSPRRKAIHPLSDAEARVETVGQIETRRTITRNVLLLGKSKRVDNRQLFLTIEGPSFQVVLAVDPDKQTEARVFAAELNTIARRLQATEEVTPPPPDEETATPANSVAPSPLPPPPSAPQGWYPDPSGSPYLRWFDGAAWTDHTAAKPQQTSS